MISPKKMEQYKHGWAKRKKKSENALKIRYRLALKKANECARVLKGRYGIKKVILFGSTVNGKFSEHSDIDLAIYGVVEHQYPDIAWALYDLALPFKVDLVPIEQAPPRLQKKIKEEGKEL